MVLLRRLKKSFQPLGITEGFHGMSEKIGLSDVDVNGKNVLTRVDFNVPMLSLIHI